MTKRNRNILLICGAILLGSYFVRSYSNYVAGMEAARARAMQRAAMSKPVPVVAESPAVDPPLANLAGAWDGRGPLSGRGLCYLHLELKQNDPKNYTGYSTFQCMSTEPLAHPKDLNVMTNIVNNMKPDSAILSGTVEKGEIRFHTDKAIGTDANNCSITELTITPFGARGLAAEWKEGTCPGANLMLQRAAQ